MRVVGRNGKRVSQNAFTQAGLDPHGVFRNGRPRKHYADADWDEDRKGDVGGAEKGDEGGSSLAALFSRIEPHHGTAFVGKLNFRSAGI